MKNKNLWMFCCIAAGLVSALTFTPLITPEGVWKPSFMGMPYTLWAGILQAILLVAITWLGTRVHPGRDHFE